MDFTVPPRMPCPARPPPPHPPCVQALSVQIPSPQSPAPSRPPARRFKLRKRGSSVVELNAKPRVRQLKAISSRKVPSISDELGRVIDIDAGRARDSTAVSGQNIPSAIN
eukprot:9297924-Pyramimonas_sp.AAC.1